MSLDIRIPIGLMFATFGTLVLVFGLITYGKPMYAQQSLGININVWWGLVMLIFGLVMLWLGRRGTATAHLAEESPEGRAIEETEHRKGLEH